MAYIFSFYSERRRHKTNLIIQAEFATDRQQKALPSADASIANPAIEKFSSVPSAIWDGEKKANIGIYCWVSRSNEFIRQVKQAKQG